MDAAINGMFEMASRLAAATEKQAAHDAVVDLLGDIVPASAHGFYELLPSGRKAGLVTTPGVPRWFIDAYEELGRSRDPIYMAVKRDRRPVDSGRLLHWRRWQQEPVYDLLDQVGFQRSLQVPVYVRCCLRGTINVARSKHDPPFSQVELCRLAKVQRLVSDVYTRLAEEGERERVSALYASALDAMAEPVVVSSRTGEVLLLNRAARKLTAADGQTLASHCQSVILHNIRELRSLASESVRRSLEIPSVGFISVRTSWLVQDDCPTAISYLYRRGRAAVTPPLDHSPLTVRERELVALFGQGLTVREIAEETFISTNTVKQHLKRIYTKLNVHSRAEMVQALWESSMLAGQEA